MNQRATLGPGIGRRARVIHVLLAPALLLCSLLASMAAPSKGLPPAPPRQALPLVRGTVLDSNGTGVVESRVDLIPDETANACPDLFVGSEENLYLLLDEF
ncbi:MAG TPA: hypothetical protein VEO94_03985, partial [Candidatus Dormibacteraeota bacterium]|nr:hypothetical protein [Candidatus Dormibacteraeota bacterium]